jgi:hypothetical protein
MFSFFQTTETQTDPVLEEVFDWDLSGSLLFLLLLEQFVKLKHLWAQIT